MEKKFKSRPTQKQIADKLGLSAATVSLALRDNPVVAKATRELVQQAMRETGYVRNIAAASLRTGRSNIVGVSVRNMAHGYYGEMLIAIERAFAEAGTVVLINNHGDDVAELERFVGTLATYGADALLVTPPPGTPLSLMDMVRRHGMPVMYLSRHLPEDGEADYVGIDNRSAARMAVEHLRSLGYGSIYMLGGHGDTSVRRDRLEGFREALSAGGAPSGEAWIECTADAQEAQAAVADLLPRTQGRVGFVCYNDRVGAGAIAAIRAAGREPGRDVGLVTIGGSREATLTVPALTTVAEEPATIGRIAAERVLERLSEPDTKPRRVVLNARLTMGQSCGAQEEELARTG